MVGDNLVKITAIISLTVIEVVALLHGIDSAMLGLTVAAISGLGGYAIGRKTGR